MSRALRLAFVAVVGCSRVDDDAGVADAGLDARPDTWREVTSNPPPPRPPYDGGGERWDPNTTGKTCVSHTDCDPDGEEIGYCTNGAYAVGPLDPTPICLLYGPEICAPSDATTVRLCDSDRGICRDAGSGYTTCEAKCEFAADGTWLTQCAGKNACNLLGASSTGTTLGRCVGGCQLDADCPTGSKCDPTLQYCVYECTTDTNCTSKWPGAPANWVCDVPRGVCHFVSTKSLGDACATTDDCPVCLKGATTIGTCTQNCVTGGAAACPTGFTCDPIAKVAVPNGVAGHCLRDCSDSTLCAAHEVCDATPGIAQKTCRPK